MPQSSASTHRLTKFYGQLSSLDGIMAALSFAGIDTSHLEARDLYTRDLDCHNLGMHQMLEHLANVTGEYGPPASDDTVLDLGCGMGGPGRFLVDRFGCSVVGVDLLPLRIDIAEALTRKTGLDERITYHVADATDLPLRDHSVAQVWMLDVGMHIRDKQALFGEIARVLQPGGLLVMHDQTAPIPEAMRPLTRQAPYHAPELARLIRYIEDAGLRTLTWRDTTTSVLDYFLRVRELLQAPREPAPVADSTRTRESGIEVLDAYIETLADCGGRTGLLIAEHVG